MWTGGSLLAAYGVFLQSMLMPSRSRFEIVPRFLLLALAPLIPFAAYHLRQSARVLRLGYTRGDMLQSLRAYAVEQREESALQEPSMPSWLASLLRVPGLRLVGDVLHLSSRSPPSSPARHGARSPSAGG